MVVSVLGAGNTFGDIDAFKQRRYMYTLRSKSRETRFYELDASQFVMHLRSNGKLNVFKQFCKD